MKYCLGCQKPITPQNDSAAHIIPNALGGRLAPKGILCQECNGRLNDAVDLDLINAFQAWPTLLDISRQNGPNHPKTVGTRLGYEVQLDRTGSLTRKTVSYDLNTEPGRTELNIGAPTFKIARQLLERAAKEIDGFDVEEQMRKLVKAGIDPDNELVMNIDLRPSQIFGGVVAAIWLYLIHTTGRAFCNFDHLFEVVEKMKTTGGTFRYLIHGLPGLKGPDIKLGHKLVVRSVPKTGNLIAYVEILGVLKVGGVFAGGAPGHEMEYIYAYDVGARSDRSAEYSIDATVFEREDWKHAGYGFKDAHIVRKYAELKLEELAEIYYRQRTAEQP